MPRRGSHSRRFYPFSWHQMTTAITGTTFVGPGNGAPVSGPTFPGSGHVSGCLLLETGDIFGLTIFCPHVDFRYGIEVELGFGILAASSPGDTLAIATDFEVSDGLDGQGLITGTSISNNATVEFPTWTQVSETGQMTRLYGCSISAAAIEAAAVADTRLVENLCWLALEFTATLGSFSAGEVGFIGGGVWWTEISHRPQD